MISHAPGTSEQTKPATVLSTDLLCDEAESLGWKRGVPGFQKSSTEAMVHIAATNS